MDWQQRCIRTCTAALVCAVLIRMACGGYFAPAGKLLENPQVISFLVYLQTGRVVRLPHARAAQPDQPTTQTTPAKADGPPVFTEDDLQYVNVLYDCDHRPDLASLLRAPLSFDLSEDAPSVLIVHTHTTESYTQTSGQTYEESSPFRTLDPRYNMLAVGDLVAARLEEAGIQVIHDRNFHDYPSYNGSYDDAAASTDVCLEQYPSIRLILDLHRDASSSDYAQMVTQCTVDGKSSAQLMMVVGTDAGGLYHPNWQENLSVALKLHTVLEKKNPGICRDLKLATPRYNQHFTSGAMLIEVGSAGNTLDEALTAADALAEGIIALFGK